MTTGQLIYELFGKRPEENDLTVIVSARLDESGTDGRSPYVVVAGAIATPAQWDILEVAWARLLKGRGVSAFHTKEFQDRTGDFDGWGDLKCKRFSDAQAKIINRNIIFRIAVGVEKSVHAEIKERMRGIKGFRPDSDYGLCLRYLMFGACKEIAKINPDARVRFMLEDGPWADGAVDLYRRISRMTGKWKPAKFAHMLGGIAVVPKGECLSLEVADYLAGFAHRQMMLGRFAKKTGSQFSILLKKSFLERWEEGMLKEKEHRRAHWKNVKKAPSSQGESS